MITKTGTQPGLKINLLALAYIAFIALGLPASLMGVAWPTLRADLSQPLDALGYLLISSTVGYLLSSFTIARLISRFGIGALLVFSCLVSVVTFLGYAIAPSWAWIVALGGLGGFGGGVMDAGLNTYLASEYNESQMQWLHACFGIGATLSPLIMTASLTLFASWRPAFLFVGVLMLLLAAGFLLTLSAWKRPKKPLEASLEPAGTDRSLMDYQTSLWNTLFRLVTWVSILLFLLYTGAEYTLGNWTYTLLTESRGVSPQLAGLWAGGFWATFTIGRILAGLYAHRLRPNSLMYGALALALAGAILLWWNPITWIGIAGVLIVGFAMAPIFPGMVSSTGQRVGQSHAGNTIGIQMSAAGLGGALLPSLAGFLARRISLETIPVVLAASLFTLLALYWLAVHAEKAE